MSNFTIDINFKAPWYANTRTAVFHEVLIIVFAQAYFPKKNVSDVNTNEEVKIPALTWAQKLYNALLSEQSLQYSDIHN